MKKSPVRVGAKPTQVAAPVSAETPKSAPAPIPASHRHGHAPIGASTRTRDLLAPTPVMERLGIATSLSEIHRRTGLSLAHVSRVMNGNRMPSLAVASVIAASIDVSIDKLFSAIRTVRQQQQLSRLDVDTDIDSDQD